MIKALKVKLNSNPLIKMRIVLQMLQQLWLSHQVDIQKKAFFHLHFQQRTQLLINPGSVDNLRLVNDEDISLIVDHVLIKKM